MSDETVCTSWKSLAGAAAAFCSSRYGAHAHDSALASAPAYRNTLLSSSRTERRLTYASSSQSAGYYRTDHKTTQLNDHTPAFSCPSLFRLSAFPSLNNTKKHKQTLRCNVIINSSQSKPNKDSSCYLFKNCTNRNSGYLGVELARLVCWVVPSAPARSLPRMGLNNPSSSSSSSALGVLGRETSPLPPNPSHFLSDWKYGATGLQCL